MATTTILTIHINKGKTPKQCVAAQLNYIMNSTKTNGGALISSHACMPETAVNEFMLYRQEYFENTGREIENEVLVYHVRQAFKPDEITSEEANEIGKELASRMTNDQFAYVVATHIDKHHVHNHIVICSTALDCQHKYRDVKRSGKDLAQLSDEICEEHQLSVIRDPQNKTVSYDKWQGNQRRFTHRDELRMIIDAALRMQPDGFDALMQLLKMPAVASSAVRKSASSRQRENGISGSIPSARNTMKHPYAGRWLVIMCTFRKSHGVISPKARSSD